MTTSKSIEEIINDEAKILYPHIEGGHSSLDRNRPERQAYIAGRSQNLAREKEYREALRKIRQCHLPYDAANLVDAALKINDEYFRDKEREADKP